MGGVRLPIKALHHGLQADLTLTEHIGQLRQHALQMARGNMRNRSVNHYRGIRLGLGFSHKDFQQADSVDGLGGIKCAGMLPEFNRAMRMVCLQINLEIPATLRGGKGLQGGST